MLVAADNPRPRASYRAGRVGIYSRRVEQRAVSFTQSDSPFTITSLVSYIRVDQNGETKRDVD